MSIGIVIATFGDWGFDDPRTQRALRSAETQADCPPVVYQHAGTLAEARNLGAEKIGTDFIVNLDADDELAQGYTLAMQKSVSDEFDIYQPKTLGVQPDGTEDNEAVLIPQRDLLSGNYLIIGSMVRAERFFRVGGFAEFSALEDWDLMLRLTMWADAKVTAVSDAVYRVHVRTDSRNSNSKAHNKAYRDIRKQFFG